MVVTEGGNMTRKANDNSWSTEKEIRFIDGLGTWGGKYYKRIHEEMLKKYLKSMKNRTYWGTMDDDLIRSHVRNKLGV
jgi:hypothetical protein